MNAYIRTSLTNALLTSHRQQSPRHIPHPPGTHCECGTRAAFETVPIVSATTTAHIHILTVHVSRHFGHFAGGHFFLSRFLLSFFGYSTLNCSSIYCFHQNTTTNWKRKRQKKTNKRLRREKKKR